MAFGTVLTRKWPVPLLTFTARQLAAGLCSFSSTVFDPPIPMPTGTNVLGTAWLDLIGAGLTYFLWFRDLATPGFGCFLGFLSPGTANVARMVVLGSDAGALEIIGVL